MAPDAFWTSPQLSPSAATAPAANTASSTNWIRAPSLMVPATTSRAPSHRTSVTPPNITSTIAAVITARALIRLREAAKASSTARPNRVDAVVSRPKAWTVSSASMLSPAKPTAWANWSCDFTVRARTRRP